MSATSSPTLDVSTAKLALNTGASIPQVGLGVWQAPRGAGTRGAVATALRLGYRRLDTARIYGNEADVGAGIRQSGVPRRDVFVTTKLWNDDQGFDSTLRVFDAGLGRLGLDDVDLYLLHWPVEGKRFDSWRAIERLHGEGRARAIGVSNFISVHLEELLDHAAVVPAVDQIEVSPSCSSARPAPSARGTASSSRPTARSPTADASVTPRWSPSRPAPVGRRPRFSCAGGSSMVSWCRPSRRRRRGSRRMPPSSPSRSIPMRMATLGACEEGLVTGWDPRDQA